jgi:hypothetical protein
LTVAGGVTSPTAPPLLPQIVVGLRIANVVVPFGTQPQLCVSGTPDG